MSTNRIHRVFLCWLQTTLLSILAMVVMALVLVLFLLIFRVPSFEIGHSSPPGILFNHFRLHLPHIPLKAGVRTLLEEGSAAKGRSFWRCSCCRDAMPVLPSLRVIAKVLEPHG